MPKHGEVKAKIRSPIDGTGDYDFFFFFFFCAFEAYRFKTPITYLGAEMFYKRRIQKAALIRKNKL